MLRPGLRVFEQCPEPQDVSLRAPLADDLDRGRQPVGTEAERAAYTSLRAELLARLDNESDSDFNMRVANEEFFKDFKYPWLRVHEHDDLHHTTCYGGTPLALARISPAPSASAEASMATTRTLGPLIAPRR